MTAERSEEHATEGRQALKVDFPGGAQFPGIQLEVFGRHFFKWKGQRILLADVFNASVSKVDLQIKIKSGKEYPKKSFERTFPLAAQKGTTIEIPIAELGQQLDLEHISCLNFFLISPQEQTTIYFDNIRVVGAEGKGAQAVSSGAVKNASDSHSVAARRTHETLRLKVDPGKDLRPVNRMIYGSNLAAKMEFEMDVIKFAKEMGITNLRFPGGGSDGYRWKLGKFDFSDRANDAPLAKMKHVIEFSKIAGAELVIQVNVESGTPQEAAEWVDFMNKQGNSRVTYWELGNEVYGDWDKAYMSGEKYAEMIKSYASAMKAVDPTIKIGADLGGPNYDAFDRAVIRNAADDIDFVSYHWYPNHVNPNKKYQDRAHPLAEEIMANSLAVRDVVNRIQRMIEQYAPQRQGKIEVTFLEWDGSWDAVPSDENFMYNGMMWSLANGIFYADTLGQFALNGVTLASQFSLQEVMFGMIRGWDKQAGWGGSRWDGKTIRPKALAMQLFSKHFGDILIDSQLEGSPTYYKEQDWRPDSYVGPVPYVSAYASRFTNEQKIALILINKHATDDFRIKISFENVVPQPTGQAWILSGPSLSSQNDGDPGAVAIQEFEIQKMNSSFVYKVPAHSVCALEIPLQISADSVGETPPADHANPQ